MFAICSSLVRSSHISTIETLSGHIILLRNSWWQICCRPHHNPRDCREWQADAQVHMTILAKTMCKVRASEIHSTQLQNSNQSNRNQSGVVSVSRIDIQMTGQNWEFKSKPSQLITMGPKRPFKGRGNVANDHGSPYPHAKQCLTTGSGLLKNQRSSCEKCV